MSKTLSMIAASWDSALILAACGKQARALKQLRLLLSRQDMPEQQQTEAARLAGELALKLAKYSLARRYLKVAASADVRNAATYYMIGMAWENDPDGCDRRAAYYYNKAMRYESTSPLYLAAFGRAAARCGIVKRGKRAMIDAASQAPADLEVIRIVVGGLAELGKIAEAEAVVTRARFSYPGNCEITAMWQRLKFEAARLAQREAVKDSKTRANTRYAQDAPFARDGDRVTIPFVRPIDDTNWSKTGTKENKGQIVRRDAASTPCPHLTRLHIRKAD